MTISEQNFLLNLAYCSRLALETFRWSIVLVCTNPANTETEQNLELKNSVTLTIYNDFTCAARF